MPPWRTSVIDLVFTDTTCRSETPFSITAPTDFALDTPGFLQGEYRTFTPARRGCKGWIRFKKVQFQDKVCDLRGHWLS